MSNKKSIVREKRSTREWANEAVQELQNIAASNDVPWLTKVMLDPFADTAARSAAERRLKILRSANR